MTANGAYRPRYKFLGGSGNGAEPRSGLIDLNGTLYGTTQYGGSYDCLFQGLKGCGTVYTVNPAGAVTLLYSFAGGPDAKYPTAYDLTYVRGSLYGTTTGGGTGCPSYGSGCGTVYRITPSGGEKVLFSFGNGSYGSFPSSGVTDVNGTLYGTNSDGGSPGCLSSSGGCGTVYSLTTSGKVAVLHSFTGGSDGEKPSGDLINVKGVFVRHHLFRGQRHFRMQLRNRL